MKASEPVLCSMHPDEKLRYWCYDHGIAVCRDCLLFGHKDDKYVLIVEAAKDASAEVSTHSLLLLLEIFSHLARGKTAENAIITESPLRRDETNEKSTENTKKTGNTKVFAALHVLIDQRVKDLLQEIDAIEHIHGTATETHQAQLTEAKKILEGHGNELITKLVSKNRIKILQEQKKLANNLTEVDQNLSRVTQPIA